MVTEVAREQIRPNLSPAVNAGTALQYDSAEPIASAIKKQRVERKHAPARISNSKVIEEDPSKLNGVQMKDMYTVAPVHQMRGYVLSIREQGNKN
mgnify:CR=1 FL=1